MASTSSKSLEALAEKVGRSLVLLVHCVTAQHLSPSTDWHPSVAQCDSISDLWDRVGSP